MKSSLAAVKRHGPTDADFKKPNSVKLNVML